ncbi:MAG: M24 family metallopeptidase [Desulfovermiculus sp.]|nr:M24 family metallopeptidase [Desulfovermiculus sp.]
MEAIDTLPRTELQDRWARVRKYLAADLPAAQGVMVMSRTLIFWLSGHWGNGLFWLPVEGEPVLMVRKGLERAKLESPVGSILPFRSPGQVPTVLAEVGQNVPRFVGVDMGNISWAAGQALTSRLEHMQFVAADHVLAKARAVKSQWELATLRLAGQRHNQALHEELKGKIQPGMSEREISKTVWTVMYDLGHQGQIRMNGAGEELYLGVISVGDSGNYPTVTNGPVGYRGAHPGVPQMGYAGQIWQKGQPLIVDTVFQLEGYHTDKTQVYFAGDSRQVPKELNDAQAICQEAHAWLKDNLRPGAKPSELYAQCLEMVQKRGWKDGFMGIGQNQVPFVGHGIGIYVDDWPALAAKFDAPLEEDMVLALEPKIGIPGQGMVGVENTCQVTSQGGVCLTGEAADILCL